MAVSHFLDRGFRNFAYYGTPPGEHYYYDLRCEEFVRVLERRGFYQCDVYSHKDGVQGWEASRKELANWVVGLRKPVAVMTCHDDAGLMLLDACQDAGIDVPGEVAVLGVNNDEFLCNLSDPPLSSVDMGAEAIGYETAALLSRTLDGEVTTTMWTLYPPRHVVTRRSTDIVAVSDPHVARAALLIREYACKGGVSVEELLAKIPISRTSLYLRFKAQLGCTPKQQFTRVRMERARDLLINSKLSVAEIAERVGYEESKYFIAVFARHFSLTPFRFRKQHQRP